MDDTCIVVFTRAPDTTSAKTRLAPLLGQAEASRLHSALVRRAIRTALATEPGRIIVSVAVDAPSSRPLSASFPDFPDSRMDYLPQVGPDLGSRMDHALTSALEHHAKALLMGTDCPAITPALLRDADNALSGNSDAVFIPVDDGGYVLVGLRRSDPVLFAEISWGTDRVMIETRERMSELGWRWHELAPLWDVDRPEDYERLQRSGMLADILAN
jgi:rSAM/selenodomain-associated transferase 1